MLASDIEDWKRTFGEVKSVYEAVRVPTIEQYLEGLERIEDDAHLEQKLILVAQYLAPQRAVAASELKQIHPQHGVINSQYARLADRFCKAMKFLPVLKENDQPQDADFLYMHWHFDAPYDPTVWKFNSRGKIRHWAVWSNYYQRGDNKDVWVMHPEVAAALELSGWIQKLLPELSSRSGTPLYSEGKLREICSRNYERSPLARRKCLERYGYQCQACGQSLSEIYGSAAARIIHAHHRNPLSGPLGMRLTDPYEDLVPVCPNCHAVIHSRNPEYELEEIQKMIQQAKGHES